ncbi:hypothetical protein FGO68_gene13755 [Halteria grandinella]|uniref:DUF7630 domain-containing protein n=1 Tax=Halteria grandinella TaxID=5974 RepID=A0A8J8TA63_HALGN|nr:hypothetical protein FGO68_gene13755 [Halteria grandinella]
MNTQNGTCDWGGEYCSNGHWQHGCEKCLGDPVNTGGNNWIMTTTASEQQSASHFFTSTFRECVQCQNNKWCTKCIATDITKCQACPSVYATTPCTQGTTQAGGYTDANCAVKVPSQNRNCAMCKDGFYIKTAGNTTSSNNWDVCEYYQTVNKEWCSLGTLNTAASCDECVYGYSVKGSGADKKCYSCQDNKFYPGVVRCNIDTTTGNPTASTGCRDGYADSNGKCVSNCGVGKYGKATYASSGKIIDSKCYTCNSNCYQCVGGGSNECISCKAGFYLSRDTTVNTWGSMTTSGSCVAKAAAAGGTYYDTLYVINENDKNAADVQSQLGTAGSPFNFLIDGIAKALELGAPYTKAEITIRLKTGVGGFGGQYHEHWVRPITTAEKNYIPSKYDFQQTTSIIIMPDNAIQQVIYFKLRDKFTFNVGAGLTLKNVKIDADDSTYYPEYLSSIDTNTASASSGSWKAPKDPTEQCLMTQGLGAGLFTFDINSQTKLTTPPTLTLDTVEITNVQYEFNSLIEMNPYGGRVVIKNSKFTNINSCGALIRNKQAILSRTFTPGTTDDYYTYYLMRSYQMLYDMYTSKYATAMTSPFSGCTETAPCSSIVLDTNTFSSINKLATLQTAPVTVNAAGKLQYMGIILDLDNFPGSVSLTGNTFTSIGPRYSTCTIARQMDTNPVYSAAADEYPSYGVKDKYQIKSLISLVNHKYTADFISNTFLKCAGTKGIIYLDMKHKTNVRRAFFYQNTFTQNSGYYESSVIFIRARGPVEGGSVYTRVPYDTGNANAPTITMGAGVDAETPTNYYCSGYHFEDNLFQQNIGCTMQGGGVIKFECVDYGETSSLGNDKIIPTSLTSAVLANYQKINHANHNTRYESVANQPTVAGAAIPVDLNMVTFKSNEFNQNFGTGGLGLVDIKGAPRVQLLLEKYTKNGDSVKEAIASSKLGLTVVTEDATDMTIQNGFNNAGSSYGAAKLMKSLINIERSSQLVVNGLDISWNWMIENECTSPRAQVLSLSDFSGQLSMTNIAIADQIGYYNTFVYSGSELNLPTSGLTTIIKTASSTQLFYFSPSVTFKSITLNEWSVQRINYYESSQSGCSGQSMIMSIPGDQAVASSFVMSSATLQSVQDINCYQCTSPMIVVNADAVAISNTKFSTINPDCYSSTASATNNPLNPLILFKLKRPFKSGMAGPVEILTTQTITLSNVQVDTFQAQSYGANQGRVFEFEYLAHSVLADERVPSSNQVVISNSAFSNVKTYSSGQIIYADMSDMRMSISLCSFTGITGQASSGQYGGVIQAVTLGQLTIDQVTATNFAVTQTTSSNGGGGFLYTNQNQVLAISITTSTFTCSSTALTTTAKNLANSQSSQKGSAIHLDGQGSQYSLTVSDSTFTNCYSAYQGGALSLSQASSSKLAVTISGSNFIQNSAIKGGSIYCRNCEINPWSTNVFNSNYADQGGDIYVWNLKNTMSTNPVMFSYHKHTFATGYSYGGSIYYLEDNTSLDTKWNMVQDVVAGSTKSELTDNSAISNDGGFMYANVAKSLTMLIQKAIITSNTAAINGGFIQFEGSGSLTITVDQATVSSNLATAGTGSLVSSGSSIDKGTITFQATVISDNEAKTDGGLLYLDGSGAKSLTFDSCTVTNAKATSGGGGVSYMKGSSTAVIIKSVADSTTNTSFVNTQSQGSMKDGGAFANYITGGGSCTLTMSSSTMTTTYTMGKGGMFFCSGSGTSTVFIQDSQLDDTKASGTGSYQKSGGVFYIAVSGAINWKSQTTKFATIQADYIGGFAYLKGSSVTAWMNTKSEISQLYSKSGGGSFYLESGSTGTSTLTLTASTVTNTKTDTVGGLVWAKGGTALVNIEVQSVVTACTAKTSGGVVYLEATGSNTLTLNDKSVISGGEATDQYGGISYMLGQDNYLTINNGAIASGCSAKKGAGCFYFGGIGKNEIVVNKGTQIESQISSSLCNSTLAGDLCNGGVFYLVGNNQKFTLVGATIQSVKSKGHGGIIYSAPSSSGATVKFVNVDSSIFTEFYSAKNGSFMYVSDTNAPTVTLPLSNSQFECSKLGGFGQETDLWWVMANLANDVNPTTIGGLFHFQKGVKGEVLSKGNVYEKCNTTVEGAVFYAYQDVWIYDEQSRFRSNAGKKGLLFCDHCTAYFNSSYFEYNVAREASLVYLRSEYAPGVNVTFYNASIMSGISVGNGGAVSTWGQYDGWIQFLNTSLIQQFTSGGDGGFFFIDNPKMKMNYSDTNWNHLYAYGKGGYIYGNNGISSTFSVMCKLGNITSAIDAGNVGPDAGAGGATINGCIIPCGSGTITEYQYDSLLAIAKNRFSMYRYVSKQVVSTGNTFRNCLGKAGAIFNLIDSELTDEGSVFESNGGVKGGVAYCKNCKMTFKGSNFTNNFGTYGGLFYIENNGLLRLEDVIITQATASEKGGIVYGEGGLEPLPATPLHTSVEINIVQTANGGLPVIFENIKSYKDAGLVYLKNGKLVITDSAIKKVSAGEDGGLIYTEDDVQVTIVRSNFSALTASRGGFIYSTGLSTQTSTSTIAFQGPLYFTNIAAIVGGGGFYFNHPKLAVDMKTLVYLSDCHVSAGNGGVFFLENIKTIDFSPPSGSISNYTNFSVPNPYYGSFMYSLSRGANIGIKNCNISCSPYNPDYTADIEDYLIQQNSVPKFGGAFYIQDANVVTSQDSNYFNCYQTNKGSIFYLKSVEVSGETTYITELQENGGSQYFNNQAEMGGLIYCDSCNLTLNGLTKSILITKNYAREGGVIYIRDTSKTVIAYTTFKGNKASMKGGLMSLQNPNTGAQGTITISSSIIDDTKAISGIDEGVGGAIHFDTIRISAFNMENVTITKAYAEKDGGVFYVSKMKGTISLIKSKFIEFKVSQTQLGSFFYSGTETDVKLLISESFIKCSNVFTEVEADTAVENKVALRAGAIYMESSILGIVSDKVEYYNCYQCQDGGIFTLVDTKLFDSFSKYVGIQALYGGVMKCTNCEFTIKDSVMDDNRALQGGIFLIENSASGTVQRTSFINTKAQVNGGLMSVIQSGLNSPVETLIQFLDCPNIKGSKAETGAVFYLNQPYMKILLKSVTIQYPKATVAAVARIDSGLSFSLENVIIQNVAATESAILYSQSPKFTLSIASSTITCDTLYSSDDQIAPLKKEYVEFNSTNTFFISGGSETQVKISKSTFSQCGPREDGGIFRLEGKVNFTDTESTYQDNSAIEGGVWSCSGCNITLEKTKLYYNQARRGGVLKLEASGNLTVIQGYFEQNSAYEQAGVLFVTTQSLFNIKNTDFIKNYGNVSSTIDVLGGSSSETNYIESCTFENNRAEKNTLALNKAKAVISKTYFRDNTANERTKNLFLGFAEVNISDCTFKSPIAKNAANQVLLDDTLGSFIFVILDVTLLIQNSVFVNGLSRYGGALYISGSSTVSIESSLFSTNMAAVQGGAIYANGFKGFTISKNTRFINNLALSQGDDFYMSNTEEAFSMDEVTVDNPYARNSIHAEYVQLIMNKVTIQNINKSNKSEMGAAIQCLFCRRMVITNSLFSNLKSQMGGAIYLTDQPENKRTTTLDKTQKYLIKNTIFTSIDAYVGGALYLDRPQSVVISDSTFTHLRALNKSDDLKTDMPFGIGGAIYYSCGADDPDCSLTITGKTQFVGNFAQIKGGAIHWDYYEPVFGAGVEFSGNKAGWYGDSISCYAQQLKKITLAEYKGQVERINFPISAEEAAAEQNSTRRRLSESSQLLTNTVEQSKANATGVRSGGKIPEFYVAHVDKYGQIVAEFDSKIRVAIDDSAIKKDENTIRYTPILAGTQQYTTYAGVAAIDDLEFSAAPGYNYKLTFLSTGIDEELPQNEEFKELLDTSTIDFDFNVTLRECEIGEYFTEVGKCIKCDAAQGYSLKQMVEPGDCEACPSDKAECSGGNDIGPKPGYWRSSNTSDNFLRCPNPDVCLGWVSPDYNPMGACAKGYSGVLCAECEPGYSLTGLAKCAKCPDMVSNVIKLSGMMLLIIGIFTFMVRSTLNSATQPKNTTSVYMKILMNHFQLILLVSSFNFQWPEQLESFFKQTGTVSEAGTQVVSVDCFLNSKSSIGLDNINYFYTFFVKLLIFALIPFILLAASYGFWALRTLSTHRFERAKAISTLVISLFIIHPNIVQYMFNDFNCKDIDGTQRVYVDMTIVCYQRVHSFWSYTVAMPSIIVWGLGIPFFAFILMYRERTLLHTLDLKQKFGFLYNGYQLDMFFWEIVIMYRKIAMIFISVFIQPQGVITQAMIVFLLMIIFLIINMKKKPYVSIALNDLETMSLLTSAISIYCGIFFITNIPPEDLDDLPQSVKGVIALSPGMRLSFFFMIILANLVFFGYWAYKMINEVKNTLIKKFEKGYLLLCLCGDRVKLEQLKHQQKIDEENEQLREGYFKAIGKLKGLYKDGKLILTHQTLERAIVYLNEDRYLEALGLAKREITEKDQRRFNRVTQGAQLKENEKAKNAKGYYSQAFRETLEAQREQRKRAAQKGEIGDALAIEEEFMSGNKLMGASYYTNAYTLNDDDNTSMMGPPEHHRRPVSNQSLGTHIGQMSQDYSNGTLENVKIKNQEKTPHDENDILGASDRSQLRQQRLKEEQLAKLDKSLKDSDKDETSGNEEEEENEKQKKHLEKRGQQPEGANIGKMLHKGQLQFKVRAAGVKKLQTQQQQPTKGGIKAGLDRSRQRKQEESKVIKNKNEDLMDNPRLMETKQKMLFIDAEKIERDLMKDIDISEKLDSSDESHDRKHKDSIDGEGDSIDNDIIGLSNNKKKGNIRFNADDDQEDNVFSDDDSDPSER